MGMSYCYIDYAKRDRKFFGVSILQPIKEILIKDTHAHIYFSISSEEDLILIEDGRFVLLVDGSLESQQHTAETLLVMLHTISFEGLLERVNGVFSLLVYDKEEARFYLSRDHFGLKQFYYYKQSSYILFSNTLHCFKACDLFQKEIDFDTLGQYLQHSYILQPYTMFKDCYKIQSAHYLELYLSHQSIREITYWDLYSFYSKPKTAMDEAAVIAKSEVLLQSVMKAQVGDAKKVGAFLSGGYDSSMLVALLRQDRALDVHTFSVGFKDDAFDEAPFAQETAAYLQTNHHEIYFSSENLRFLLTHFAEVYDEPIADMAVLPTMLVATLARKEGVKILFGGEGGDEVFASSRFVNRLDAIVRIPYPLRWFIGHLLRPLTKRTRFEKLSKMMLEKCPENIWKYRDITLSTTIVRNMIKVASRPREMKSHNRCRSSVAMLDRFFPLVLKSYVSNNLLTKVTFATKHHDIEAKTPYLDRRFVEFLAGVDMKIKRKNDTSKYILREILTKYLPEKLINRPKKGFSVPAAKMIKEELIDLLDIYINEERLRNEGIFNVAEVMKHKKLFLEESSDYDQQNIWNILIFQIWYASWFEKEED